MNYEQTIDFLYKQLPAFQQSGKASAVKYDLTRIQKFCNRLGNPEKSVKMIHIAGTNGKGTTAHLLAAILQQNGYKTGLYTSPHLKEMTERIKIDGKEIPKHYVVDFVAEHKAFIYSEQPSFFELTAAMAFDFFARKKCDVACIEVGMGGRLDSTNVVLPEVAVITNISLDHQAFLGDTLGKIAGEKAGIIKQGRPVVIGEYQEETIDVFTRKANQQQAPLVRAWEYTFDLLHHFSSRTGYFLKNARTALAAVKVLQERGFIIDQQTLSTALDDYDQVTGLKGRWQKIGDHPLTICDTGHNIAGISGVLDEIRKQKYEKLHIVFGVVADKELSGVLSLLPKEANYYFCQPSVFRGLPAETLQTKALAYGLKGVVEKDVNQAIRVAGQQAGKDDFIFVGGSNFVIADLETI